jgi:hypothetical protein
MVFKKREFRPWKPALLETAEEKDTLLATSIVESSEERGILIGGFFKPTQLSLPKKTVPGHVTQEIEPEKTEALQETVDELQARLLEITERLEKMTAIAHTEQALRKLLEEKYVKLMQALSEPEEA